jgi:hypothetical protein
LQISVIQSKTLKEKVLANNILIFYILYIKKFSNYTQMFLHKTAYQPLIANVLEFLIKQK